MKHLYLLFIFFILSVCTCYSQRQWYVNAGLGPINYVGDLQEKRFTPTGMKFAGTAGITYQLTPHFAGNFSLTVGKIGAKDADNGEKWARRNLNFQSMLFEAAVTAEADLTDINQPDDQSFADRNPDKITPYVFGGLALVHFNPYTYDLSNKKVYLQPLGTEGQAAPYSLWQISFPFGIGVKYAISNTIVLSAELSLRKTLTDYMDDVSRNHYVDTTELLATRGQEAVSLSYRADELPDNHYSFKDGYRGNPKKKDGYYGIMFKLYYQLFTTRPKFYYGY